MNHKDMGVESKRASLVFDEIDAVQNRMGKNVRTPLGIAADWPEFDN
jgi:hypothetical protein